MAGGGGWYVNLLWVSLYLYCAGLCKNSSPENCEFILYNGTDSYSVVLVRMNITAEIKVQYNQTFNGTKFRVYY